MTRVLFVCLGNICRSPLAEAIFTHMARERGVLDLFTIDSAGTGDWHCGHGADPRSIEIGARHGIEVTSIARQIEPADITRFDLLLAMDRQNRRDLLSMGASHAQVRLIRSFDPDLADASDRELDVPDPYLGGSAGFEDAYQMLDSACVGLLDHLVSRHE